ncbi:MAG: hypothetical protein K0R99_3806 [Microbacterium sp.]|jgi:hypothetical protein|uniref:hypothetical protein n=1 Tax=Microbacterium sp. TaxID=51671 RepID=UPI002638EDC7|nr:hypothetical protein [Microbacterium sp.]MDF2562360.1 hypothetical protein [Microbacterium sp.]
MEYTVTVQNCRRPLAIVSVAILGGAFLTGFVGSAAQANDDQAEGIVDAVAAERGVFRTISGDPITVESDDHELGERVVTGVTGEETPVQILIQSSAIAEADRAKVEETVSAVPEPANLTFSEEPPGPVSGEIETDPLSDDPKDWEVVSVIAFTDSTASFAWPEKETFSVYEGDSLLGVSEDGLFVTPRLEPEKSYTFSMIAASPTARSSDDQVSTASRTITFQTFTGVASEDQERLIEPRTYQPWYNQYVHKTFIPDLRVGGLQCNLNHPFDEWHFGGDLRTYEFPAPETPWGVANYRTMMFVNVNWDNPAPHKMSWVKDVGSTRIYKNGNLDRTLYANMDSMTFHDAQANSSYAKIRLQHYGSNPGCALLDFEYSGAITYGETVEFYRSGTISVDGSRFRAPAHEMYGGFTPPNGSHTIWKTIARLPNDGFECLLGPLACSPGFYEQSASY